MRKMLLPINIVVVFPLALLISVDHVEAKVVLKEQTKFYNIYAKDGRQLYQKLGRRGPWRMRRKHAVASTTRSYDIRNIKFAVLGERCVVTNVDVHMTLVYYYPKWINKTNGSKKLQKLWKQFSNELVRHERTHGKYFRESMHLVEREILRTKGSKSSDCSAMDKNVNERLKGANSKGEAKHVAFDKREMRPSSKLRKLEKAIATTK